MEPDRKTVRTSRGLKQYTCLGCPLTRNRSTWCFRLCSPDDEGKGRCGRLAPHGLQSRIQLSIEEFNKRQVESHCEKLERQYLSASCSELWDPGVRISEGEAEILLPIRERFHRAPGVVHDGVCFAAMNDSAALAVNSLVEKSLVMTASFNVHFSGRRAAGELVARGRFLDLSGDHYLAESVLTDSEDKEIGRGHGAFTESGVPLSAETGYE